MHITKIDLLNKDDKGFSIISVSSSGDISCYNHLTREQAFNLIYNLSAQTCNSLFEPPIVRLFLGLKDDIEEDNNE